MLQNLFIGMRTFLEGVAWLRKRPGLLALLLLPALLGVLAFLGMATTLWAYQGMVYGALLFTPTAAWWSVSLYYVTKVILFVALLILSAVLGVGLVSIVAAPIYELVSLKIETDLLGRKGPELTLWQSLRLIKEEAKKMFCIISVSILLLLIPGVNVISTLMTAFLVGWDFYDYPLVRRGYSFRQRWSSVKQDGWQVMGLGLWLIIPFAQVIVYPLAVAGGTMISVRRLQKEGRA